jgi:aminoglycoside phosphotransferase (APT) family kinase protein
VLSGLKDTAVRVPRTVLSCEDESVIGAPFYLMERARGVVIRNELPEAFSEEHRGGIGDELVDALIELHGVDPAACGLEGFGKPTGYLERQLRRWRGQMELTLPMTRPLEDLEAVGSWLERNLPRTQATTIVHGDYKLDNVMFDEEPPARLTAILDWEMSTLGDPLADLGWMISFWREPDDAVDDVFANLNSLTTKTGYASLTDLIALNGIAAGVEIHVIRVRPGRVELRIQWRPDPQPARHVQDVANADLRAWIPGLLPFRDWGRLVQCIDSLLDQDPQQGT